MTESDNDGLAAIYRYRAKEIPDRATTMLPEVRAQLLDIAKEWEQMADDEDRRKQARPH